MQCRSGSRARDPIYVVDAMVAHEVQRVLAAAGYVPHLPFVSPPIPSLSWGQVITTVAAGATADGAVAMMAKAFDRMWDPR